MQRGLGTQKPQYFSIRSVIQVISDDVQPMVRKALPPREMILVGEVVDVPPVSGKSSPRTGASLTRLDALPRGLLRTHGATTELGVGTGGTPRLGSRGPYL
ncbi:hypothetical protein MVI01_72210 [Myxococcus virescens]|uniref:Uncharacterized protein n=1 Tax=Myxococcus virescens TaxID=83456 RepID=A0A511HPC0_9BACT|nr:hypothetical protein MVI01_72210 [Myxococcus virescens]SDE87996.1 hypothetical protein SAMN04488504_1144 [Myxococcus virescens]